MQSLTRRSALSAMLAAPLISAAGVRVEPDGMLSIEGRRTFLLGLYQLPNVPDSWRAAASAGFHVANAKPDRAVLDEAARRGMRGWIAVGSEQNKIRQLVNTLKDHPALLYWETEDEPSFVWNKPKSVRVTPEKIRQAYALVKQLDPGRPLYLNHSPTNLVTTLQQYNPGGDLIATDIYPVMPASQRPQYALWPDGQQGDLLDTSVSQVGRYVDKMRQVAGQARGLFMVLQGFAWEMLRDIKDRDARAVLYPSPQQTRFMAYQAIAHGVTGLLWWGLHTTPPESALWESIASVSSELKQLAAELAAPATSDRLTVEYHDTGHSLDRGIEWTLRPSGNGAVLIAVNADKNPVDATICRLLRFRGARVLFESRRPPSIANGRMRDEFEPFQARVYRLET